MYSSELKNISTSYVNHRASRNITCVRDNIVLFGHQSIVRTARTNKYLMLVQSSIVSMLAEDITLLAKDIT